LVVLLVLQNFNILKPTGHVMHQQFNTQQLYALPTLYLYVLYLPQNKQRLVPNITQLTDFYNRKEKCLQRGTDWVFKYSSLSFVCKWPTNCLHVISETTSLLLPSA